MRTQTLPPAEPGITSVTVRVPATTANLGPGFDCLGLALNLWNQVTLSTHKAGLKVELVGEGSNDLPADESNLVVKAIRRVYEVNGKAFPAGLHLRCKNRIPTASGLGSSAAAILAGLLAANTLLGNPLNVLDLLRLGTELEGHPDNIAAAYLGGLVLVAHPPPVDAPLHSPITFLVRKVNVPPFSVAVAVPDVSLTTQAARQTLPGQVTFKDAVFNMGRALLVVEALRAGDLDLLGRAMHDRLHQPYRLPLIPGAPAAIQAALDAGAGAAALSGAGPGVIAFCRGEATSVADSMVRAFNGAGVQARGWGLRVSEQGYAVRGVRT